MTLEEFSDEELATLGSCLLAATVGPFFPDWEFHTLFGLERAEVAAVAKAWPKVDLANEDVQLAVNNALNNLVGYPHHCENEWDAWIPATPQELVRLFCKWRGDSPRNYFHAMM
jgi:hypothetical protein